MFTSKYEKVIYTGAGGHEMQANFQRMIPNAQNDIVLVLVPPPGSSVLKPVWQTTAEGFAEQGYQCIGLIPPGKTDHIDDNDSGSFSFRKYTDYLNAVIQQLLHEGYTYKDICISSTSMAVTVVAKMVEEKAYTGHLLFGAPVSDLTHVFSVQQGIYKDKSEEELFSGYAMQSGLTLDTEFVMKEIKQNEWRHCGMHTIFKHLGEDARLGVYRNKEDLYLSFEDNKKLQGRKDTSDSDVCLFEDNVDDPFKHKFSPQTEKFLAPKFTVSFLEKLKKR